MYECKFVYCVCMSALYVSIVRMSTCICRQRERGRKRGERIGEKVGGG